VLVHFFNLQPIFNCQRTFDREDRRCSQDAARLWSALIFAFSCGVGEITRLSHAAFRLSRIILGGADRVRTDDPLLAKQVLSQLSYSPGSESRSQKAEIRNDLQKYARDRSGSLLLLSAFALLLGLVGLGRFELPTSRLSGVRSKPTEL
jgi:hypothetical protein